MSLTVACVWLRGKGKRKYPVEYVTRLRSMVARHLDRPHRLVCLTDLPDDVPGGIDPVRIKPVRPFPLWWAKTQLFSPKMPFDGRVLYLDLDVLVTGDLAPIVDFPAPFAICPDSAPGFTGKRGLCTVKRYNSSVMVWDHGARSQIHTDWRPEVASRLWSDQDWIAQRFPHEATFPAGWFRRVNADLQPPLPEDVRVVLCIKHKNHEAAALWPWVADAWR